jgi:hypothetical protein
MKIAAMNRIKGRTLFSLVFCVTGGVGLLSSSEIAVANSVEVRAFLQCGASAPADLPAFDRAISFTVGQGKLTGERTVHRRPGTERYQGSIESNGSLKINGMSSRGEFHSSFSGQLNDSGETILTGKLVGRRSHRDCSISFLDSPDQLRVKLGLAKADSHDVQKTSVTAPAAKNTTEASDQSRPPSSTKEVNNVSPQRPPSQIKVASDVDLTHQHTARETVSASSQKAPEVGVTSSEKAAEQLGNLNKDLASQISLLQNLTKELQEDRQHEANSPALTDQTITLIQNKLQELQQKKTAAPDTLEYQTPVRPNDGQSFPTARNISESYPPIPYYIAGTPEVGDFWVLPQVSDTGQLEFKLRFIDPNSSTDKIRAEVIMSLSEVEQTVDSLRKLYEWSETAHKNRIRKEFEKRTACFPAADCPAEGQRLEGKSSTELVFHINDEGFTNGAIRRYKGIYAETYSFSIESGLMLRAYMMHVINEAKLEYQAGSETNDALGSLFK